MTIDSEDDSKISNRTINTNRISNRTYDSKSNRITKLRRSLHGAVVRHTLEPPLGIWTSRNREYRLRYSMYYINVVTLIKLSDYFCISDVDSEDVAYTHNIRNVVLCFIDPLQFSSIGLLRLLHRTHFSIHSIFLVTRKTKPTSRPKIC